MEQQGVWSGPIVTEVEPLETFYPAKAEHHGYYRKNPRETASGSRIQAGAIWASPVSQ